MDDDYEVVWDGKGELSDSLERDYAAMTGDGWDLIWIPPSALTTPWSNWAPYAAERGDEHVVTNSEKPSRRRYAPRRTLAECEIRPPLLIHQVGRPRKVKRRP